MKFIFKNTHHHPIGFINHLGSIRLAVNDSITITDENIIKYHKLLKRNYDVIKIINPINYEAILKMPSIEIIEMLLLTKNNLTYTQKQTLRLILEMN